MHFREMPPAPSYTDLFPWKEEDNLDDIFKRTLNAAWNLLLTRDVSRISFRELASDSGVPVPALYRHFPSLDALAEHLALGSLTQLRREYLSAFFQSESPLHAFRAILEFAQRRPHHFGLIVAPRFTGLPRVLQFRSALNDELRALLERWLQRAPDGTEEVALRIQLLGGAVQVASGMASLDEVLASIVAALKTWRRTTRRRKAA
jgi:AcrR family transcriptional regulator